MQSNSNIKSVLKREAEVAFSKHSQPIWFRITKYVVLSGVVYLFWDSGWLWLILLTLMVLSLLLHFWYRYKTKAWTNSYGLWKHEQDRT
jgi:hypothetical protein